MEIADQIAKLKEENDDIEKKILTMSHGQNGGGTKALADNNTKSLEQTGIKVLNFGGHGVGEGAGKDHGSSWCPPQCSRRTVLGGFFTS